MGYFLKCGQSSPRNVAEEPFGNIIRQTGGAAEDNPFRFGTKYHDDDTGLVYYGYRWYDPVLGRWLSRDPAEEWGGLNLYGFVGNSPVNFLDVDGRAVWYKEFKFDKYKATAEARERAVQAEVRKLAETMLLEIAYGSGSAGWTFRWIYDDWRDLFGMRTHEDVDYLEFVLRLKSEHVYWGDTPGQSSEGDMKALLSHVAADHKRPWDITAYLAHGVRATDTIRYRGGPEDIHEVEDKFADVNGVLFFACRSAHTQKAPVVGGKGGCDASKCLCWWRALSVRKTFQSGDEGD